ncbi:DUF1232 domain-containing protein [candidate division KSB1 bacterium]|nr:DUF1232 domain-containing protein [candidate division KSB1 bacterium]
MKHSHIKNIQPEISWSLLRQLPQYLKLNWRLFRDRRVPFYLKLVPIGALVYVISPIDLIPDWMFPIIGEVDDIAIVIIAFRFFMKRCPRDVVAEHVRQIESE